MSFLIQFHVYIYNAIVTDESLPPHVGSLDYIDP